MSDFKFILEPYSGLSSRYACPSCGKRKTFTRYIDTETQEHLADHVGICSRMDKCAYHYTPKQYYQDNKPLFEVAKPLRYRQSAPIPTKLMVQAKVSVISKGIFQQSLHAQEQNNFIAFLKKMYGTAIALELAERYHIGTSKHWKGATVFWQVDIAGEVRTGKIMLYDPDTGKRVKEPYNHITWVHSTLKVPDFNLQQCYFGEHLLGAEPTKPVAVVESEKTAVLASLYLPDFIWLAVGSLNNLSAERCNVLKGRNVVLWPDLNAYDKWSQKAEALSSIAHIKVSDLLERMASETERTGGFDLGDYLLRSPAPKKESTQIQIHSTDIIRMLGSANTGSDFEKLVIRGIKTKDCKVYDLLFTCDGELIKPGEKSAIVKRLADFFEKRFVLAYFDGAPCWAHLAY